MKVTLATLALIALHGMAAAQQMSAEELLRFATDRKACGEAVPLEAFYDPEDSGVIRVRCSDATGFVPVVGALGAGGGIAAAAAAVGVLGVAVGGGGSTASTN